MRIATIALHHSNGKGYRPENNQQARRYAMTHREEFQPLPATLPEHYLALIETAEKVLYYKCECAFPNEKKCTGCVFGPLRSILQRIKKEETGGRRQETE
jgi:hypothetical protein